MRRGVIDGDQWVAQRLVFLRNLLELHELPEGQRKAAEAEVAMLRKERGLATGGFRMPRVLRRLHVR